MDGCGPLKKGHPRARPIASVRPFPRAQREQIEKERLEQEKKAADRLQHANELRRQVRENQQKQVQNRLSTFEEGRRLKEEAQKRRERIEDIKKQKLDELRCAPPRFLPFSAPLLFPKRGGTSGWKSRGRGRRSRGREVFSGRASRRRLAPLKGLQQKEFWNWVLLAHWQLLGRVLGPRLEYAWWVHGRHRLGYRAPGCGGPGHAFSCHTFGNYPTYTCPVFLPAERLAFLRNTASKLSAKPTSCQPLL